jgi:bifunctional UDP-N-acetylglucosamine pyrophosphorylase/glucosamine-1-phosphate N-acetyltransferase
MLFERLRGGIGIHAVILAAGRGSRMGVLSDSLPKGLIPIAGKTIIARLLEVLVKSGVHSLHIGVGWKGELFKKHLLTLADSYPLEVVQVSSLDKGPLHTLSTVLERWDAEPFLICPVDYVVTPIIVKQLIKEHKRGGDSRAVTVSMSLDSRYGSPIYVQSGGRVSGIGTSLIDYDDVHWSAMIVAANSEAIRHFRSAHESGEKTVVAVLNEMVSKRMNVYAANVDGVWFDIDSISDLLSASNMILNGQVEPAKGCIVVPPGDTIEIGEKIEFPSGTLIASGVSIEGPAFIGPACRIEQNCRVGPGVSMENGTELAREATLERCILFGSARVNTRSHINDAIVYGRKIIVEESE